jgi:hypothetical protein
MEIELKLSKEEAEAVVSVLGQLQTSTGAWPLMVKIRQQIDEQDGKQDAGDELLAGD